MTRVMVFLYLLAGVAPPAVAQVDQQRAQEFFKEAQALCEHDGGRLWGVSICAPIADARTQTFATSQPAPEGAQPRVLGIVNAPVLLANAEIRPRSNVRSSRVELRGMMTRFLLFHQTQDSTASSDRRLMEQLAAVANRKAASLQPQQQPPAAPQPSMEQNKVQAALIGATVGGAVGALSGALYCTADCGGGRPRGALVFGATGAGIGAGVGLLIAMVADR